MNKDVILFKFKVGDILKHGDRAYKDWALYSMVTGMRVKNGIGFYEYIDLDSGRTDALSMHLIESNYKKVA
jgi:hypothetical protein